MKKGPLSHQKIKCLFLDYVQLLMVSKAIWAKNVDRNAKKWKQPSKSLKNEMFIFGLHSTSDDRLSNLSKKCWLKHKKNQKMPPKSYQNIKCSFLDYIQLLMIGQAIRAKNIDQNTTNKKGFLRHQKIKCSFFLLHSTSDDRLSNPSKKRRPKSKKMEKAPRSLKIEMFIFGLRSTSDDRPSDLSKKRRPKCKKMKKAP